MTEGSGANGGPISWRSTYDLLGGVEDRLGKKIDDLADTVGCLSTEVRNIQLARATEQGAAQKQGQVWRFTDRAVTQFVAICALLLAVAAMVAK